MKRYRCTITLTGVLKMFEEMFNTQVQKVKGLTKSCPTEKP